MRGCRIPVAVALRDAGIGGETARWIERVRGPYRPLVFSLRNAFRRRWRTALTMVTLASGGAAFLGALDLRASIRDSVRVMFDDLLRFDVAVRLDAPHAADSVEHALGSVSGIERAELWSGARATLVADGALAAPFPVTAIPSDSRLISLPVVRGRALGDGDARELLVNTRLLDDEPRLVVGTRVDVAIGGRTDRWTVVGLVESAGPQPAAFTSRAALARATGDARVSSVVVRSPRDRTEAAQSTLLVNVRDALEAKGMPIASSQLSRASRRSIEDHLLMVGAFLLAMAQLTVVVGALALGSTMSLAVRERTREMGVLRAIGATPRAIIAMVQAEGLLIAMLSWLIAIPLSLPVSVLLARAFGRIMLPITATLVPQWNAVWIWLAMAVLVSLAACAWPARRATRISTAAAIAYE